MIALNKENWDASKDMATQLDIFNTMIVIVCYKMKIEEENNEFFPD